MGLVQFATRSAAAFEVMFYAHFNYSKRGEKRDELMRLL